MKTTTGGDARTRGRKVFFFLLAVVGALVITTVGSARVDSGGAADVAALAAFTPSSQVQFTLSACRLPDANNDGLPDYTLPTANGFVCNDADYTTGNLGKNWNELDLVPHRLQMSVGNQASATTDFNVIIAADHKTGVRTGYDIVSVPVINVGKSDASCTVSADAQSTIGGVTGGADEVMYRTLTVHLAKGKTCVIDYVQRLALGAHLYPGSSLQSYMFESDDFKTGKKTISIPVNQIAPQELSKDMSANRGSDHVWDIKKAPTPAELKFENTCDSSQSLSSGVQIKVTWEKKPATASGPAAVITHVYAKNPAARVVTVNVTDKIYEGSGQTNLLDEASTPVGGVDVPANTTALVLTHSFEWNDPTSTSLNDVATATYFDKIFPDVPIPGQTEAKASATIQLGSPTNASATINDVESISGAGLSYSADSFSGASGGFDGGYVAGTKTTGNVSWTSDPQTDSGDVTFDKTVYVDKGTIEADGHLKDTATITGSDGFSAEAKADVSIAVNTIASLTIDKTISNILQGNETATFNFHVKSTNDVNAPDVASASISFAAGETNKTADVNGLAPGVYYVFEDAASGWNPNSGSVAVDLSGANCSGTALFKNEAKLASAKVKKVTNPAGFEANWKFDLKDGQGNVIETQTTSGSGFVAFATKLGEGSYSIVEHEQDGWTNNGGSAECTFTVNLPGHADKEFACTYTNTYKPSVVLDKSGDELSKIGDAVSYTILLTNTSSAGGAAGAPSLVCDIADAQIGFSKTVTLAPGAFDSSVHKFTIPAGAGDPYPNTATADCHYPGLSEVVASSQDSHSINLFQPAVEVEKSASNAFSKAGDKVTYTVKITNKSSSDAPPLKLDSFTDSLVNGVTPDPSCDTLAYGGSCSFSYDYTVQAGDADPLLNTATAHYHPAEFPNDISDSGSASVDLVHPAFTVTKECTTNPVDQGGTASFKITYKNTGDADLVFTPDDQANEGGVVSVPAGQTKYVTITRSVPDGATSVDNTVTGKVTLAAKYGLSNEYPYSKSDSCKVKGKAKVVKTVSGQPPAADQQFTFQLRQGATPFADGNILETKITDASGNISFATQLVPGQTYQICEQVFVGWNTNLAGDGPLFVPNSMNPGPPPLPNPNVVNLIVCANFTVTSGQTRTFNVDNTPPPGGRALTIGFWKNWSSCSGGNQKPMLDLALAFASQNTTNPPGGLVVSAQNQGALWPSYAATWYLVLKGDPASTEKNIKPSPDCVKAVNLLNKSTIDGKKKMASDPLFNMTAQLVGAQLNRFMGAGISGPTITNIDKAVLLNGKYKFNGLNYSPALTTADKNLANCLGTQLDEYNNNRPVTAC